MRFAAFAGFADYSTVFTWKTWIGGWFVRVLAQVAFFALIGRLLDSEERTEFLLIGNAVQVAVVGSLFAVAGTTWERYSGTLPLLVASPSSPVVVFSARSAWAFTEGFISSLGAFFVVAPLFDVALPWPEVILMIPLTGLVGLSSYALGTFLGGLVLRAMSTRNVVGNVAHTTIMAICGVNVPLAFYPETVQWAAHLLPVTHGLAAIRDVLDGSASSAVLTNVGLEALVGAAWLSLALVTFDRLAEGGRRDGSIEFGV